MDILVVYHGDSSTKYVGFSTDIHMETYQGELRIYKKDHERGSESIKAIYRDWKRVEIEKS